MKKTNQKESLEKKETVKKPFYKSAAAKVMFGALGGFIVIYFGFSAFFQSHFCFGTTISGMDVGGKSVEQVKKMLTGEIGDYSLEILGREGLKEEIAGSSIAVEPVFRGELEQLISEQNEFAWLLILLKKETLELEKTVAYDEEALEEAVVGLSCMQTENQRKPVNASCSGYESDGYAIIPADYGTTIEKDRLIEAVGKAVLALEESLDIDEAGCYAEPEIGDDNEELLEMMEQLNTYAATRICYDFEEEEEILDGSIISEWLHTNDDFEISIDEEAVLAYVKDLARKYNTAYQPKKLMTSYGQEVTISTGPYGWKIDNAGETAQILEDIKTGEIISREPVYSQRANSHGDNDYGDSYVEINLTAQHLYLYKDGKLITESDLVSGCVAKGNATPTGAYPVTYTTKDAVLRGEDYATPVSYWMPFNGNIGMHDLTSRKAFGGDIYKTRGSHGCINLPYSAAKTIYENIEAGYAVLVYELPGTQSVSVMQKEADSVIAAINSIGNVSLASEALIVNARNMYNALDSATRSLVTNYSVLVNAESLLEQLKAEQAILPPPDAGLPVELPVTE